MMEQTDYADLTAFAMGTPDRGFLNQILGALRAISELTGLPEGAGHCFLLPEGVEDVSQLKESIFYSQFKNYPEFRKQIFTMMDSYMSEAGERIPRIFITAYNLTESLNAGKNTDMLCRAVKEYYAEHNLGFVLTTVLTSRLHKYKYVDLINVPKHLLTFTSRIRLLQNKKLRKKVLITVGTINNFNRRTVKEKQKELLTLLKKLKTDKDLQPAVKKLETFQKAGKKVVFCLGGRVEGPEIGFDINYAKKLYAAADKLARVGYGVVFVNGPRTPNDVTDFLYEKSLSNPQIVFQNCKKIAVDDSERAPKSWRIYSGKHEDEFRRLQKIGNIYPGIIGFENTLVVHSADTYASCETANAALPTAISKGLFIDPDVRPDCLNLFELLCPKYAIDFDEFVYYAVHMKIEPRDLRPQVLSSPLRVFAETAVNRLNQLERKEYRV